MIVEKNVGRNERAIRIAAGIGLLVLVPWTHGLGRWIVGIAGFFLVATALVGR